MVRLNDTKFATKLAALVGVLFVGFGIFGWVAADTLGAVEISGPAYRRIVQTKDLVADVLPPPAYILESHLAVLQLIESSDAQERSRIVERLTQLRKDFETRHRYWNEVLPNSATKQSLVGASYEPAEQYFTLVESDLIPAVERGDMRPARALVRGELTRLYEQHRAAIDAVVRYATVDNSRAEKSASDLLWSRTLWLIGTAVLVAIGGVAVAVFLARRTTRPLAELTEVARAVASGDLTQSVSYEGNDEIGELAAAFRSITERVGGALTSIAEGARTLTDASDSLSVVSHSLAAGAEQTSVQADVVSSASVHINDNIAAVATGANEMVDSVREIARATNEMRILTESAVDVTRAAGHTVELLGESGNEITDVVRLINSIAEQTNLLALNATIEAARAGDAGTGFAVVAGEVKDLAQATARATASITERVATIQGHTADALASMESMDQVIARINESQSTIAAAFEEQTATTAEIGRNADGAARGSGEIAANIAGVAAAAREASVGAVDAQRAAAELHAMADRLGDLVGQFKY